MTLDFAGTLDESSVMPPSQGLSIELARVGWWSDTSEHADVTADDLNGRTLIRCTLLRGGMPDQVPPEGEARGMEVRVQPLGPLFDVPLEGSLVVIGFPGGFSQTAGAGFLLGVLGTTPDQYSKTAVKLDAGADRDRVLKGRSVTMTMHSPTGAATESFVSITPADGISACDADGFGFVVKDQSVTLFAPDAGGDAKTMVRLTKDQLTLANKDSGNNVCSLTLKDKELCAAGLVFNTMAPGTNLGATASAATPAICGVGTAVAVQAWLTAFDAWVTNVQSVLSGLGVPIAIPLPPNLLVPSAAVNVGVTT
jgi:hypothetical protein